MRKKSKYKNLWLRFWPFGILFLLVVIYFWRFVFLGKIPLNADWLYQEYPWKSYSPYNIRVHNPEYGDPAVLAYPMKSYTIDSLKKGHFPLWNPYIFSGTPFLASIFSFIFSPNNIVFFIFSLPVAYGIMLMLILFLAGVFMYIFLKDLGLSKISSLLGAVVFILNGYISVYTETEGSLTSFMYLPLLFYLFRKSASHRTYMYPVFAGMAVSLMIFSGYFQITTYFILAGIIYYFYQIAFLYQETRTCGGLLRYIKLLGIIIIVAASLSSIQLLPSFEFMSLSHRFMGMPRYFYNSLPWRNLITVFIPNFFGHPADHNYVSFGASFYDLCIYIGILPFMLAVIASFLHKNKETRFFVLLGWGILFFLLALNFSLFHKFVLKVLPLFDRNSHVRLLCLFIFSLSILSAFGFDYVLGFKNNAKAIKRIIGLFLFLVILGIIALLIGNLMLYLQGEKVVLLLRRYLNATENLKQLRDMYSIFNPNMNLPFIFSFISIAIIGLILKFSETRNKIIYLKIVTMILVPFDLLLLSTKYNTFIDRNLVYPQTESIRFIKSDPDIFRVTGIGRVEDADKFLPPNTNMPYKIQIVGGYDSLSIGRYVELIWEVVNNKPITASTRLGNTIYIHNYESKLLDLLNEKYILTNKHIDNKKFELVFSKDLFIYKNKDYLPRAFIVPQHKVIRDKEGILKELKSPLFVPSQYIILEENIQLNTKERLATQVSFAKIAKYEPNEVVINAFLDGSGFLVLSDTFYPGWEAYVDGKQSKIYCADYILRALYLSKGEHIVRFVYRPCSFLFGRNITVIALSFIAIYFLTKIIFLRSF